MPGPIVWPDGRRFAFTMVDDTDGSTVDNVQPLYDLLHELGLLVTKTVWPVGCPEGSADYWRSETLEDARHVAFALDLRARGFEVTWHGATMESSPRERTLRAIDRFAEVFGAPPRLHLNHSHNRENLYWGVDRIDDPLLRAVIGRMWKYPLDHFQGHREGSPFWWGDAAARHVEYARNLTFNEINLARVNPSMPYRDPARPLARWWFSSADADGANELEPLLAPQQLDQLEAEGGFCIVATHFAKGFVEGGRVRPAIRARLEDLARRPGWFVPAGPLLDFLRARREAEGDGTLPGGEWRRMQWRWARGLVERKLRLLRSRDMDPYRVAS
jgi:hypothetical protein